MNQNARNESWEKEREPKREARGDAEELTETRRSPRHQATRWREKAKPTRRRRVPSREVGEEPDQNTTNLGGELARKEYLPPPPMTMSREHLLYCEHAARLVVCDKILHQSEITSYNTTLW